MSEAVFDRVEQLSAVQSSLLMGEMVYAVYDGLGFDTALLGLTNFRVVLQDETTRVGTVSLVSVPYSRIQAVGLVTSSSSPSSFALAETVLVRTASTAYEIRLRDHARAQHAHDVILHFLTR